MRSSRSTGSRCSDVSLVKIKQGDTRPLDAILTANQQPVSLVGATVRFHMVPRFAGGTNLDAVAVLLDAAKGQVRYMWQPGDLATPGLYWGELEVTFGDGTVETFPNGEHIAIEIIAALA